MLFGLSARIYKTLNTTYSTILAFKSKKIEFRFVNSNIICTFALAKQNTVGAIAQLVEQRTENPCVPGSIPGGTTIKRSYSWRVTPFLLLWCFVVVGLPKITYMIKIVCHNEIAKTTTIHNKIWAGSLHFYSVICQPIIIEAKWLCFIVFLLPTPHHCHHLLVLTLQLSSKWQYHVLQCVNSPTISPTFV